MAVQPAGLELLPNEIIIQVLSPLSTTALLPLSLVSSRFYAIISRILHYRLLQAATLKNHNLILECYHPTAKLSTPGMTCEYLYTDPILEGSMDELTSVYSHFRPEMPEVEARQRRPAPVQAQPNPFPIATTISPPSSAAATPSTSPIASEPFEAQAPPEQPSQLLTLESHELFSQLVTVANLVKVGPKRGLFLSCVTIEEGVVRVWREWLRTHAVPQNSISEQKYSVTNGYSSSADDSWKHEQVVTEGFVEQDAEDMEKRTLWLDRDKNVGVRLRVVERPDLNPAPPVMLASDEEEGGVWEIVYEELFIKTTRLLLKVEESLLQENNHSGKAIVIGSW